MMIFILILMLGMAQSASLQISNVNGGLKFEYESDDGKFNVVQGVRRSRA